jgi:hypothetical protein
MHLQKEDRKETGNLGDTPSQPDPFPPSWLLLQTVLSTILRSVSNFTTWPILLLVPMMLTRVMCLSDNSVREWKSQVKSRSKRNSHSSLCNNWWGTYNFKLLSLHR